MAHQIVTSLIALRAAIQVLFISPFSFSVAVLILLVVHFTSSCHNADIIIGRWRVSTLVNPLLCFLVLLLLYVFLSRPHAISLLPSSAVLTPLAE